MKKRGVVLSPMQTILTLMVIFMVLGRFATAEESVDLPLYGPIEIAKGWKVFDHGGEEKKGYHWVTLQKSGTGDYLSFFVTARLDGSDLSTLSDTAHELLPDGRFRRPGGTPSPTIWSIRSRTASIKGYAALEYSFVSDYPNRDDLLSHGYVIVGDVLLFIQHTSKKAITHELVSDHAHSAQKTIAAVSDSKNLKLFTRPSTDLIQPDFQKASKQRPRKEMKAQIPPLRPPGS